MFGFLKKNPKERLQKQYEELLGKAMTAQRSGDIRLYSEFTEKAEVIRKEMAAAEG